MESKNPLSVPIWQKYTLSIDEATQYFHLGRDKLRRLAADDPSANWLLMGGSHIRIKRKLFEKMIDEATSI